MMTRRVFGPKLHKVRAAGPACAVDSHIPCLPSPCNTFVFHAQCRSSGEALVRLLLRPINPSDLFSIGGIYGGFQPKLPAVPGLEGAHAHSTQCQPRMHAYLLPKPLHGGGTAGERWAAGMPSHDVSTKMSLQCMQRTISTSASLTCSHLPACLPAPQWTRKAGVHWGSPLSLHVRTSIGCWGSGMLLHAHLRAMQHF